MNELRIIKYILVVVKSIFSILSLVIVMVGLVSLSTSLYAQSPKFYHHHLVPSNGFTDVNYNEFIYKDSRGLVWISGSKGWHCYNGLEFKLYPFESGLEGGISGNFIQSNMYEDEVGDLWFSTYKAINRFVRKQGTFVHSQIVHSSGDTIQKNYKLFYLAKGANVLFLRADEFIYQYSITSDSFNSLGVQTRGQRFAVNKKSKMDSSIIIACPWIEGAGFELIQKDSIWKRKRYLEKINTKRGSIKPTIRQAIIENDSLVWLIAKEGLLLFDVKREECIGNPLKPPGFASINFMQAIVLEQKRLLIAAVNGGLWIFDTKEKKFKKNYLKDREKSSSLLNNSPYNINKDRDQQIWLSYKETGVDYLSKQQDFQQIRLNKELEETIPIDFLEKDSIGRKWIGTKYHGIYVLGEKDELLWHFPYDKKKKKGLPIDELRYFSMDTKGNAWCMSHKEIYRFEGSVQQWKRMAYYSGGQLLFMVHLKNGKTWFSSNNGLLELQYLAGENKLIPVKELLDFENCDFLNFFETSKGDILIDCDAQYLLVFDADLKKRKRISTHSGINNFYEAKDACVWISTTKGLGVLDTALSFQFVMDNPWELQGKEIYKLEEDRDHRFWISSSSGLFNYDPQKKILKKFNLVDGLPKTSFLPYSSLNLSDEKFWFGSTDGIISFKPNEINVRPGFPKVQVSKLRINGQLYQDHLVNEFDSLNLNYFENNLSFQLFVLDYHQSTKNQIRYKIEEVSPDWKLIDNGGMIALSNLSAGYHTLEMVGLNANGIEGEVRKMIINISLPYWKTLWFKIIVILGLMSIMGLVQYYYTQKQLSIQQSAFEKEQTLQQERNRIASDLHDDMGAGLSIIKFISDDLISEQANTRIQGKLEKISSSSQELFDKMKDIIWALNVENDELDQLIFYINKYAKEYLEISQVQLVISIPEIIPKVLVNGIFRRNLLLYVQEVLHNIVKHAAAQKVEIRIKISGRNLFILISDNGGGYNSEDDFSGQGIKNIRKRVHALSGEIRISSKIDHGTNLLVVVPF